VTYLQINNLKLLAKINSPPVINNLHFPGVKHRQDIKSSTPLNLNHLKMSFMLQLLILFNYVLTE